MPTPLTSPFDPHPEQSSRSDIRKTLRRRRQSLTPAQQTQAAEKVAKHLLAHPSLYRARHIAIYLANDGEIDPATYVSAARRRGIHFYLPVLHPFRSGHMTFVPFNEATRLKRNRFGIPEPLFNGNRYRPAWALDAVLFPLVGFDLEGGRLGMGGGFYDRTFAFVRQTPRLAPKLLGLAHEVQRVTRLPIEPWDIPLQGIVTEQRRYDLA
ncbi:5-formyltetrahydrofolate cyclo-ligase [Marinobacter zhejiangensis]|uniref:5-formyltetrahydrofolate cyclo-ligase n=1 Tax=Marinobacter zhejiangensis TaxID=488535 RepID=A0A1I4SJ33_9GAMM|nr:5-formyltetrahydrofolate cyclo-ligase [Marinobacter zhejiangensis]SFM64496.1 5-formyltetrahydrofolate cyclo-ligase [Marinobacter zhejiangensis]